MPYELHVLKLRLKGFREAILLFIPGSFLLGIAIGVATNVFLVTHYYIALPTFAMGVLLVWVGAIRSVLRQRGIRLASVGLSDLLVVAP